MPPLFIITTCLLYLYIKYLSSIYKYKLPVFYININYLPSIYKYKLPAFYI